MTNSVNTTASKNAVRILVLELKKREYGESNKDSWELCFHIGKSEFFIRHSTSLAGKRLPAGMQRYPVNLCNELIIAKLGDIGFQEEYECLR